MVPAVYVPIFGQVCMTCDTEPCVGVVTDVDTIRSSCMCGVCFFGDGAAIDWDSWNDPVEDTE